MEKPIIAVYENDPRKFEDYCEGHVKAGYKIDSTSCGLSNDDYTSYMAILIKEPEETYNDNTDGMGNGMITTRIRKAFFHQLEAKTGWGRNEIKQIFENAIVSVLD
jgi:hypothetical protein